MAAEASTLANKLNQSLKLRGLNGIIDSASEYGEKYWFLATWKTNYGKVELYLYEGPYFGRKRIWVGFGSKSSDTIDGLRNSMKSLSVTSISLAEWNDDWTLSSVAKNKRLRSKAFCSYENYSAEPHLWAWLGMYLPTSGNLFGEALSFLCSIMERQPVQYQSDDWDGATDGSSSKAVRLQQQRFKANVMSYWNNRCAVSACQIPAILDAAHIEAYVENSSAKERISADNGILLLPHLHRLFDVGLVSFSNDGRMLISPALEQKHLDQLGLKKSARLLRPLSTNQKKAMRLHRKKWSFLSS